MNSFNFQQFHFIRPEFLFLIGLIVLLALFKAILHKINNNRSKNTFSNNSWQKICAPEILNLLYIKKSNPYQKSKNLILSIVCLLIIIALAGPTWSKKESILYQNQNSWIIALDLSPSMEQTDISPSRLQRAKFKIQDFISYIKDEQLALIAFSEEAYDIIPLTTDKKTIEHILPSIDPIIMPSKGENINSALVKSKNLIQNLNLQSSNILLLTDNIPNSESFITAKELANSKVGVYILDLSKNSNRQNTGLKELSNLSSGYYSELTNDDKDIQSLLKHADLRYKAIYDQEPAQQKMELWHDFGPWLLILILPLLLIVLLSHYKTSTTALVIFHGLQLYLASSLFSGNISTVYALQDLRSQSYSTLWNSLWQNKQQVAAENLKNQQNLPSSDVFSNHSWKAAAEYKLKNYQQAEDLLKDKPDPTSQYNYANSLAQQGKLPEAISAYDKLLAKHPKFADAKYNKELLQKYLDSKNEQQKQENNDSSKQQDPNKNDQDKNQQNKQQNSAQNQKNQPQNSEQSSGQGNQSKDQNSPNKSNDEKSTDKQTEQQPKPSNYNLDNKTKKQESPASNDQVNKQEQQLNKWLEQIPDNPAAYLRNQLQYEYWRKRQIDNF